MPRSRRFSTSLAQASFLALFAASSFATMGCELIASPDRSKIPVGNGGSSTTGTGGATSAGGGGAASSTGGGGAASSTGGGGAASSTGGGGAASSTGGGGAATTGSTGGGGAATTGSTGGAATTGSTGGAATTAGTGGAATTAGTGGAATTSTTGSTGGAATTVTGTGGGATTASTGSGATCITPADCAGTDTGCAARTCTGGVCGVDFVASGSDANPQTAGNCQHETCDGAGNTILAEDDADVPVDGNTCTGDVCTGGVPSNPILSGQSCSAGVCDASGNCVGCLDASTCPGTDTECATRTCTTGVCGFAFQPNGQVTAAQTAGDCQVNECNGAGAIVSVEDDTDVPASDGNDCTDDVCSNGAPVHPPSALDTPCATGFCNASGTCVTCNTDVECGVTTECETNSCAGNACQQSFVTAGTVVANAPAGDCHDDQCDGSGNILGNVVDNGDLPVDNNACTSDVCTTGVPSNPPVADGSACTGGTCESGACQLTTFVVARIGDGSAALTSGSTAVFLEAHTLDGTNVGTLPLPIATAGSDAPFTLSGTGSSEGHLQRSSDGHFVTLLGYDSAPGILSISGTTSAATPRVVARVSAAGTVDTTTTTNNAISATNPRGAVSVDGTAFWFSGGNSGVQYEALGGTTSTALNTGAPTNLRTIAIWQDQLYVTSGSTPFIGLSTVGTGVSNTTGQTVTLLPGFATGSVSPYDFVRLTVNGNDVIYVADDTTVANGGGIQKWTLANGTWSKASTITAWTDINGGAQSSPFRGLTGYVDGTNVVLLATGIATSANSVVLFTDDGSATITGKAIAVAPTNTVYRGIALAPN